MAVGRVGFLPWQKLFWPGQEKPVNTIRVRTIPRKQPNIQYPIILANASHVGMFDA